MSDQHSTGAGQSAPVIKNNTMDAIVAVILFIVGGITIMEAQRLGADWTAEGPGSGYFPFYIGLIICISAAGIFYQSVISKSKDTDVFVDREQLGRVLSVLLPAGVFVLAITFLGIYVASAIYITLFMIILGKYPKAKSLFLGIAVAAFFFVMFEVWFRVPLYKGSLEPLGFLGY